MQIFVKGKGGVSLSKNNFVGQGGEAGIYAIGDTAYKIYNNPKQTIPYAKIQELSSLKDPKIINPQNIILDKNNKPIGYTMRFLKNTISLCQIFTKAFRDRNNISSDIMFKLIEDMQKTIQHIHDNNILIVDLNELNFLVNNKFTEIYFIDVDSYQTPSFPATALMESVRDRHSPQFSKLTDWFSFGIISFQMFIGIHPFKGKHSKLKTLDERMLTNVPVFHKDVAYPKVCQPFDIVPQTYKDWYKSIFTSSKRLPPPTGAQLVTVIITKPHKIVGNEGFDVIELERFNDDIINYLSLFGIKLTQTASGLYKDSKTISTDEDNTCLAITPKNNIIIEGKIVDDKLILKDVLNNKILDCNISAEKIMSYDGRIYIKNNDILSEINFIEIPNNLQAVPHTIGNVMEHATQVYDGVVIQNMLGSFVASISPQSKTCYQIIIPEFEGYKIIEAKYDNQVLMVIGNKKGKYDKFIIKLNSEFNSYLIRKVDDIFYSGINFVVLDNGIVIHINENEELEIFSNKKDKNTIKVISNSIITGDMRLFKNGTQVLFSRKNILYRLKTKGDL